MKAIFDIQSYGLGRLLRIGLAGLVVLPVSWASARFDGEPRGEEARVASLEGLWEARRDFGPEVQGTLTVSREGDVWFAEIGRFRQPVRLEGEGIFFAVPGDRGAFRGMLAKGGEEIRGHWTQPPTAANRVRYASPVRLRQISEHRWRGDVEPLDDAMSLYLVLRSADDGSLGGFIRNPEANLGHFMQFDSVSLEGTEVRFVAGDEDRVVLDGVYHPEEDVLSLYVPQASGTYDLRRVGDDPACAFFPRPRSDEGYRYRIPESEEDGWRTASLEEVGMSVQPLADMIDMIIDTQADTIATHEMHAVLIARHGALVLEEYFNGYTRETPHDMRSGSKSISTTLVGIAIQTGAPLGTLTPVYEIMNDGRVPPDLDVRKQQLNVAHLMTMTSGLACNDNDPASPGGEYRLQNQNEQPDWTQYTLDLPILNEPGGAPAYCSASPHLALAVVSKATGLWLPTFYQRHFAAPLEMGRYHINLAPNGEAYGGGGLHILARDLLKVGQMYLDGGRWKERAVLGEGFVEEASFPFTHMFEQGYGYGWWILSFPYRDGEVEAFYAGGNGGQYLIVVPELDLSVVMFAGNYGQAVPTHLAKRLHVPEFILKSVD
jgi:CubicO group peptidase (beta-lactamase class C family)